jgi:hypothetical protein
LHQVDWKKSPAAQVGQRFADISSVGAGKKRGFSQLRNAGNASPTSF